MKNTVYILGAGCSVDYGYPLARDFVAALKDFADVLGQRTNCKRLQACVVNTVSLMEHHQSPTVDRLVLRIVEKLNLQRQSLGIVVTNSHHELVRQEQDQILDAKLATVALFLEREIKARRSGLQGYRDFLNTIFGGDRSPSVLKSTATRVLSFNYDRLFEIAFGEFFKSDFNMSLYGQPWLNSGISFSHNEAEAVDISRFCLLKLHGTAGASVAQFDGQTWYGWYANLNHTDTLVDDSLFWPPDSEPSRFRWENPEPLIAFPFEKDRARSGGTSFRFDNYLRSVWGHREHLGYAEQLVQEAERIWVIGYSFDPNDRKALLALLRKSDCEIIVRNRTKEGADAICEDLRLHYSDFASRLRPFGKPF